MSKELLYTIWKQNCFNFLSIGFIQTPGFFEKKKKSMKKIQQMVIWNFMLPKLPEKKNCQNPTIFLQGMRKYMNPVWGPEPFWLIKLINFNKKRKGGQETFGPRYPTKPLNYLYKYFQFPEIWKTQIPAKHKQGKEQTQVPLPAPEVSSITYEEFSLWKGRKLPTRFFSALAGKAACGWLTF